MCFVNVPVAVSRIRASIAANCHPDAPDDLTGAADFGGLARGEAAICTRRPDWHEDN